MNLTAQQLLRSLAEHFSDYAVKDNGSHVVFEKSDGKSDEIERLRVSVFVDADGNQEWQLGQRCPDKRTWCYNLESAIKAVAQWLPEPPKPDYERELPCRPIIQRFK